MNQELCDCPSFQTKYYISFNENSRWGSSCKQKWRVKYILCHIQKSEMELAFKWWKSKKKHIVSKISKNCSIYLNLCYVIVSFDIVYVRKTVIIKNLTMVLMQEVRLELGSYSESRNICLYYNFLTRFHCCVFLSSQIRLNKNIYL